MKTRILSIFSVLLFCAVLSVKAQTTINYIHVKTVYPDGRVTGPIGFSNNIQFTFDGDRLYMGQKPSFVMGDGTDGIRRHSYQDGKTIYFYYRSGTAGLVQKYRTSQPYWDYRTAYIVSSDRKVINICYYDGVGNLQSTSVYKVPTAPGASDFIE